MREKNEIDILIPVFNEGETIVITIIKYYNANNIIDNTINEYKIDKHTAKILTIKERMTVIKEKIKNTRSTFEIMINESKTGLKSLFNEMF